MKKIAIFASGNGSNAQTIFEYFNQIEDIEVRCIISNKRDAFVLERAKHMGVKSYYFSKSDFDTSNRVMDCLQENGIDYVVLAGFLLLVPLSIVHAYKGRIINIHPALLPNYGGKGMYGMNVHKAVIENKETISGITIHLVDEQYDRGTILFQARCSVCKEDTPETLASKVHALEYEHFPSIIHQYINGGIERHCF